MVFLIILYRYLILIIIKFYNMNKLSLVAIVASTSAQNIISIPSLDKEMMKANKDLIKSMVI